VSHSSAHAELAGCRAARGGAGRGRLGRRHRGPAARRGRRG
jgi:hypothetical protein